MFHKNVKKTVHVENFLLYFKSIYVKKGIFLKMLKKPKPLKATPFSLKSKKHPNPKLRSLGQPTSEEIQTEINSTQPNIIKTIATSKIEHIRKKKKEETLFNSMLIWYKNLEEKLSFRAKLKSKKRTHYTRLLHTNDLEEEKLKEKIIEEIEALRKEVREFKTRFVKITNQATDTFN